MAKPITVGYLFNFDGPITMGYHRFKFWASVEEIVKDLLQGLHIRIWILGGKKKCVECLPSVCFGYLQRVQ